MDLVGELFQEWRIARQGARQASLEQRVAQLEHQLGIVHKILLVLVKEQRPDLASLFEPGAQPADGTRWRLERAEEGSGIELPIPGRVFDTEAEADAEARRLVGEDPQARVF